MKYLLESARGRKQGLRIPIRQQVFVIGSSRSSQIRSVQDGVGRKHCALIVHKRKLYVQDLESGHPTFINGRTMLPGMRLLLKAGDRVALGPMEFVVRSQQKKRKALAPVAAPHTAPPRPCVSAPLPVLVPTPPSFVAPAAPRLPPPQRRLLGTMQKTVALIVLAVLCMGVGWLLFQGPLAPAKSEKDTDNEDAETRAPSRDGDPKQSPAGPSAGKQPERPAKVPERKPPEEKQPPADERKPPPPNPAEDTKVRVTFAGQVEPILRSRCIRCHGDGKRKGGLDLTSLDALLRGGKSGPVVRPGSLDRSPLWESIDSDTMPPAGQKLTDAEKKLIKDWILGANNGTLAAR